MERRLFDTDTASRKGRRAITLPVSMAVHAAVVAGALILPLLGDGTLPEVSAAGPRVFFTEPPPIPVPAPPLQRQGVAQPVRKAKVTPPATGAFVAPLEIPDTLPEESFGVGSPTGDPNGPVGGVSWGAPAGAIVGGLPTAPTVTQPQRISGGVREPRKLRHVAPVYPDIARRIGLQGTVVLDCTIDVSGRVVNATVLQGNLLLNEAARTAVEQWVYTPTLLSGVPVPILMQVSVTFALR
jgi:periplasmic protein TonB